VFQKENDKINKEVILTMECSLEDHSHEEDTSIKKVIPDCEGENATIHVKECGLEEYWLEGHSHEVDGCCAKSNIGGLHIERHEKVSNISRE